MSTHEKLALAAALALGVNVANAADAPRFGQPITSADWKSLKPQSATRPAYSVLDLTEFERITGRTMRPWREALHAFRLATT